MNWKVIGFSALVFIVAVVVILVMTSPARQPEEQVAGTGNAADPQTLMIPRWFLASLTLDGQSLEIAEGQQEVTLQFESPEKANGTGGCNNFSASFQADYDGSLSFGPVVSTRMFCDGRMDTENAYFQALSKVDQFRVADGRLVLSSADGQTELVLAMPPK